MKIPNLNKTVWTKLISSLFLASCWMVFAAEERSPSNIPAGYIVETVEIPEGITLGVGGIAFAPNGAVFLTSREGQVWRLQDEEWSLFADGLHEVLGIYIDPVTSEIWVMQRPELTKLIDEDGDGTADVFRTINAEWGLTDN